MTDNQQAISEVGPFTSRKQAILHDPPNTYGDCQRTCLAMALGLNPLSIPHFADERIYPADSGRIAERAWLATQGFGYVQIPLLGDYGWDWVEPILAQQHGTPVIVSGKSPRGEWNHDVVYFEGAIHDPHPDGGGLEGPCIDKANPDEPRWYWINVITPLPFRASLKDQPA